MDIKAKQIEFEHFDRYRVTNHLDAGLIEIEVRTCKSSFFTGKDWYWKRIYFGHPNPIQKALDFYEESLDEYEKPKEATT